MVVGETSMRTGAMRKNPAWRCNEKEPSLVRAVIGGRQVKRERGWGRQDLSEDQTSELRLHW